MQLTGGGCNGSPPEGPPLPPIMGRGQSPLSSRHKEILFFLKIHTRCEACPVPPGQDLMASVFRATCSPQGPHLPRCEVWCGPHSKIKRAASSVQAGKGPDLWGQPGWEAILWM